MSDDAESPSSVQYSIGTNSWPVSGDDGGGGGLGGGGDGDGGLAGGASGGGCDGGNLLQMQ